MRSQTVLVALLLLAWTNAVAAQAPPPLDLPSERPAEVPFQEEERVAPELTPTEVLPPVPEARFELRRLRILGNTVIDPQLLREVSETFVGRVIDEGELEQLRAAVTQVYVDQGYSTSGAVIPDQDLADGELILQVIEGRIGDIRIEGLRRFREGYLRQRIWPDRAAPVQVDRLSDRLSVLQSDPDILGVQAELRPGDRLGESILIVTIREGRHFDLGVEGNNHRSPAIGSYTGVLRGELRSALGIGESIRTRGQVSEGLWDTSVETSVPLSARGPELGFQFRYADSEVVETPFDALDIESDYLAFGVGLTQTLYESFQDRVRLGLLFEWRRGRTKLSGHGFSFSEGADNGESIVAPLRLEATWTRRQQRQVIALRSLISIGLPVLDATDVDGTSVDGKFVSWIVQGQFARRFESLLDSELLARGDLQLTSDPVLSIERFSIGGHASVRGFRENQIVRDQGVSLSVELRVPVWEHADGRPILQVAPFFDMGHAWDHGDRDGEDDETLAAAGLGLRAFPLDTVTAILSWGQRMTKADRPRNNKDPQDYGIHFSLTAELP